MNSRPPAPPAPKPLLLREDDGPVAVLTLNRPAARNSLSEALLGALGDAFTAIAKDDSVRAVVLAANGPAFCAGHDLKELTARRSDADGGRAYFQQIMTTCSAMMQQIVTLPQPVIAAVQGRRVRRRLPARRKLRSRRRLDQGGLRHARRRHRPVLLDADGGAVAQRRAQARHGDAAHRRHRSRPKRPPRSASSIEVVPPARSASAPSSSRMQFASKSSHVIGIGKAAFYRQLELPLAEAYDYASKVMTENMMARDAEEGICAFIEKRDPTWEDR